MRLTPRPWPTILSRINFKVAEAAQNLKQDQAATQAQVEETHRLINQIIPLLGAGDPNAARRLDAYGRFFFSDLRDTWDLFRGYVNRGLTGPPPTLADLPAQVRAALHQPPGHLPHPGLSFRGYLEFRALERLCQKPLERRPQCRG